MYGFRGAQALVGHQFALDAFGFRAFQIQIAEAPQRLGAQCGITRIQIEKPLVAFHGLGGVDVLRRIGADVDRLIVQILDGRRFLRRGNTRRTERDRRQYCGGACQS